MLAMGHIHLPWVQADLDLTPEEFLTREAQSLLTALERHQVDLLAHPFIYPRLPVLAPKLASVFTLDYLPDELYEALVHRLLEGNTDVEYNSRELVLKRDYHGSRMVRSYHKLLQRLHHSGVNIVPGSDAHRLAQIGAVDAAPAWAQGTLMKKVGGHHE
jgi:histidinol phosphatase-like PHP family hydrolase